LRINALSVTIVASLILFSSYSCDREEETSQRVKSGNSFEPVTFAVMGNTGFVTDNGDKFGMLINAVNEYGVDFSVDLGNRLPDGVPSSGTNSLWEAVDETYMLCDMPVYPVAGSNDIFDYQSDVDYSNRYGPGWYSFRRDGTLFIALNTGDDAYRFGFGTRPSISGEQLEWLWNTLKEYGDFANVVLFMTDVVSSNTKCAWLFCSF